MEFLHSIIIIITLTLSVCGSIFFPLCIPNNASVVKVFPFSLVLPIFDLESIQPFKNDRVSEFDGHRILSAHFVSLHLQFHSPVPA